MFKYAAKRLIQAIPLLLIITAAAFILMSALPYDAVDAITTPDMKPEVIAARRAEFGLDKPMIVRYSHWLEQFVKGDFGYSIVSRTNIRRELMQRIPATLSLMLPAYLISYLIAIVLGLLAGSRRGGKLDRFVDGLCSVGIATPTFWLAMILLYIFAFRLKLLPLMGMHTIGMEGSFTDYLRHLVLPLIVLTAGFVPDLTRYIRSAVITQMQQDYVTVQKAFGAGRGEILRRHVLKNVLTPLITKLGMSLPSLITGAVITETIFSWPGMGSYFVKAIQNLDYPVVMGVLVLSGFLVIAGNLLADILYCVVDKRIRYREVGR